MPFRLQILHISQLVFRRGFSAHRIQRQSGCHGIGCGLPVAAEQVQAQALAFPFGQHGRHFGFGLVLQQEHGGKAGCAAQIHRAAGMLGLQTFR